MAGDCFDTGNDEPWVVHRKDLRTNFTIIGAVNVDVAISKCVRLVAKRFFLKSLFRLFNMNKLYF